VTRASLQTMQMCMYVCVTVCCIERLQLVDTLAVISVITIVIVIVFLIVLAVCYFL